MERRNSTPRPRPTSHWFFCLMMLAVVSCTPDKPAPPVTPQYTITARHKGTLASMKLPGWTFVRHSEKDRWYLYQHDAQQLYFAVSRYKLSTPQSPAEDLIREALLDLCPDKRCKPFRTQDGNFISGYSSGSTGAVIYNWDAARLTPQGEMLLSIVRLERGTEEGVSEIKKAITSSLKLELE